MGKRKQEEGVSIHIKTPTLDKMWSVKDESQKVGNFIEWLSERGYVVAMYDRKDRLMPLYKNTEQLLAEYFDIDLAQAERERQKILGGIRATA